MYKKNTKRIAVTCLCIVLVCLAICFLLMWQQNNISVLSQKKNSEFSQQIASHNNVLSSQQSAINEHNSSISSNNQQQNELESQLSSEKTKLDNMTSAK